MHMCDFCKIFGRIKKKFLIFLLKIPDELINISCWVIDNNDGKKLLNIPSLL